MKIWPPKARARFRPPKTGSRGARRGFARFRTTKTGIRRGKPTKTRTKPQKNVPKLPNSGISRNFRNCVHNCAQKCAKNAQKTAIFVHFRARRTFPKNFAKNTFFQALCPYKFAKKTRNFGVFTKCPL